MLSLNFQSWPSAFTSTTLTSTSVLIDNTNLEADFSSATNSFLTAGGNFQLGEGRAFSISFNYWGTIENYSTASKSVIELQHLDYGAIL